MRTRITLEIVIVIGIIGLLMEIAGGNTWIAVSAGVAAAIWLLSRTA